VVIGSPRWLIQARRGTPLPQAETVVYECPLPEWRDVAGSKVKLWEFVKGLSGLAKVYWRYVRPRHLCRVPGHPSISASPEGNSSL
jgi:hypothetical protein